MLINRGFVFPDGDVTLGYEILPSREKLRELIGVTAPIKTKVFFGDVPGLLGWLQPVRNDFKLVGVGHFEADGIYLKMATRCCTDRRCAAQVETEGFQPRLSAEVEYQEQLSRQPPKSTATLSLFVANVALFVAVALAGGG